MPRFTVRDLLIATTLVAIGAGALGLMYRIWEALAEAGFVTVPILLLLWFGGGAFIGAGLFTPFKRPWTGVICGLVIQILLFAV